MKSTSVQKNMNLNEKLSAVMIFISSGMKGGC